MAFYKNANNFLTLYKQMKMLKQFKKNNIRKEIKKEIEEKEEEKQKMQTINESTKYEKIPKLALHKTK